MKTDVPGILSRAATLVMQNRILLVLGVLLSLTLFSIVPVGTAATPATGSSLNPYASLGVNTPNVLLGCVGLLAFIIFAIFVRPRLEAGLIIAGMQTDRAEVPSLKQAWNNGSYSMWTVWGLNFALGLILGAVFLVCYFVLVVVFLSTSLVPLLSLPQTSNGTVSTPDVWQELATVLPLVGVMLLVLVPLSIFLYSIAELGKRAAALEGHLFAPAWRLGLATFRANMWASVLLVVAQFVVGVVVYLITLVISLLITSVATSLGSAVGESTGALALVVGLLLGLVLWVVTIALSAFPSAWISVGWTLLYRNINPAPAPPSAAAYVVQYGQTQPMAPYDPYSPAAGGGYGNPYQQQPEGWQQGGGYSVAGKYPGGYPTADTTPPTPDQPAPEQQPPADTPKAES